MLAVLLATVATPAAVAGQDVGNRIATVRSSAAGAREFKIAWTGDVLLGDAAQAYLDRHGYAWPFASVRPRY